MSDEVPNSDAPREPAPSAGTPNEWGADRPGRVGYGLALAFVIAGGLVAAVTGPLRLDKGSWLAAFLVLVTGVALGLLSRQSRIIDAPPITPGRQWTVIWLWIAGNALVIAGALTSAPILTDIGGAALAGVLVLAVIATRRAQRAATAWLFRIAYAVLTVSIPIGLILTHLRSM